MRAVATLKAEKVCKDCITEGITTKRPAPKSGPRCVTHYRTFLKGQKARTAAKRIEKIYGLAPEKFDKLWEAQGRRCAICWRPVRVRRPAVDHDHDTREVRGLLCRKCNYDLLGFYGVESLLRAARYLMAPPAFDVIGRVLVPSDEMQILAFTDEEGYDDE